MRVTGLVQGVFFRAGLARVASDLRVKGWARNLPDGSVEAFLQGDEAVVMRVVDWARRGPPRARVDSLELMEEEPQRIRGFRIIG